MLFGLRVWFRSSMCALLLVSAVAPVAAQPTELRAPARTPLPPGRAPIGRGIAETHFTGRDQLESPSVFFVRQAGNGTLFVGTEDGVLRYAGQNFLPLSLPFDSVDNRQVRAMAETQDLTWWFGSRAGVFVKPKSGPTRRIRVADSLPNDVVYALVLTTALDGTERVVAATAGGLAVLDSNRARRIEIPAPFIATGMTAVAVTAPDSVPELWVGSAVGQVARLREGAWMVWSNVDGLPTTAMQQLIEVHGPGAVRMLVATDRKGALVWTPGPGAKGRWTPLKGSPSDVNRAVEFVDANQARELWLGTTAGEVVRLMSGVWDTLDLSFERAGTRIDALTYLADHGGRGAVYVGGYGGGLSRVALTAVTTPPATRIATRKMVMSTVETASGDTLWIAGLALGVQRYANGHVMTAKALPQMDNVNGHAIIRWPDSRQGKIWYASDSGLATYDPVIGWRKQDAASVKALGVPLLFHVDSSSGNGGTLYAVGSDGVIMRDVTHSSWQPVSLPEGGQQVLSMASITTDRPMLFIAASGKVFHRVLPNGAWKADPLPAGNQASITALCTMVSPVSGQSMVVAGARTGELYWRTASGQWNTVTSDVVEALHPLPMQMQQARWTPVDITTMRCDSPHNRLIVATRQGLVVARVTPTEPRQWKLEAALSPADGLPGRMITHIGPVRADGTVLIGGQFGLAQVELDHLARTSTPKLFTRLARLANSESYLSDNESLAPRDNALRLEVGLTTFHRPEATLYRYQFVSTEGVRDARDWTHEARFDLSRLAAGHYQLSIQARDYLGHEYDAPPKMFEVRAQWYRTQTALVLSTAALILLAVSLVRWRLNAVERRAQAIEENEKRVRVSERKFRELFDRALDANLLVEAGRVTSANASAAALFGVADARELIDRPIDGLVPTWRTFYPGDVSDPHGETRPIEAQVPRGGELVPVTITCAALTEEVQSVTHVVLRDLTAQRVAEKRRAELESQVRETQNLESIGTLAGGVAHDFNNLLGVIRGNTELARESLADADLVADHLAAVLDASDRARDLVRQILTFSRRSTSQQTSVELGALVLELQSIMRSLIPSTVDIRVDLPSTPVWVMGDRTQLQQVLLNLCSNAEYAMRSMHGGTLTIALSTTRSRSATSEAEAMLRVSDTGVGMTAAVRERIFEPFFTTKPTGEGTGLGLSVLHGIVASHGGRVQVTSTKGMGTTFEVLLPLTTVTTGMPTPRHGVAAVRQVRPLRVVLVDDEASVAQVMTRALARDGHKVATFADPAEALKYLENRANAVDVVLTDQTMPGLTGDMLVTKLRALRPTLPVLIMTGFSYRLTPDMMARLGDIPVLQKPVGLKELRAVLAQVTAPTEPAAQS